MIKEIKVKLINWMHNNMLRMLVEMSGKKPEHVGEYIPGNFPSFTDPRLGGYQNFGVPHRMNALSSNIINIHEQCHRDLINNTYYGYVLTRLLNLVKGMPNDYKDTLINEKTYCALLGNLFQCAEGYSCSVPYITLLLLAGYKKGKKYIKSLNREYLNAFKKYLPILPDMEELANPNDLLFYGTRIGAVAEYSADYAIYKLEKIPKTFNGLVEVLLNAKPPDQILDSKIQIAKNLPKNIFLGRSQDYSDLQRLKGGLENLKKLLFREDFKRDPVDAIEYSAKRSIISEIDEALTTTHPEITKFYFLEEPQGPACQTDFFDAAPWIRPDREKTYGELSYFLENMKIFTGHYGFIFRFFPGVNETYHLTTTGVSLRGVILKSLAPFFYTVANKRILVELDNSYTDSGAIWISPLYYNLFDDGSVEIKNLDLFLALKAPVYLYSKKFSFELPGYLSKLLGKPKGISQMSLHYPKGSYVIEIEYERLSVYSIQSAYIPGVKIKENPLDCIHLNMAVLAIVGIDV